MTQNAKQGYNNGGTPPYGYRTEHIALGNQKTKAVWVLGPREEIDIIRWMFNQYAYENAGYKRIANGLNEKGVPTQKGGQWSASTIRAIIFNESYIGRKIWNKQDYQTKGKKWRDRSEWVITENAHPSIITEELFNLCQERAKARTNGGGESHKPFQTKPHSPFWLRGIFVCDKCGSRMVGNSTSSKYKGGKTQYYVCGGYLRKGKEYCSYVGWNKTRVEETVTNKLRVALMRLSMTDNLEEEMRQFFNEQNKHKLTEKANLDAEIEFLKKRILLIEEDIRTDRRKPYHQDMLVEMQEEVNEKQLNLEVANAIEFNVPDAFLSSVKYDIQALIGLLDQDVPSQQLLHTLTPKFVSNLQIHRETERLDLTVQFKYENEIVYEKTLIAEWR